MRTVREAGRGGDDGELRELAELRYHWGKASDSPDLGRRVAKNFVTGFARTLAADPAAPRLTAGRCRPGFICDHLAAGTPLRELLAITGICQAESLARYARHAGGAPPKAVLRAWDRRQQAG